jgi:hypothetical protein
MKKLFTKQDNIKISFMKNLTKVTTALLIILGITFASGKQAQATTVTTGTQVTVVVDYLEETAVVTAGTGGSTKFYISTDNEKSWEMIETNGMIDISSMLAKKEAVICFKGNKDIATNKVTLQAEDSTLKATYVVTNGVGSITFNTTAQLEYRKGANGKWKTTSGTMSTMMYEIKGATLFFRTPATTIKRAGKAISVKVSKRPTAPSIKIDGSKFTISGLKSGATEYRIGDSLVWIPFKPTDTKIKTLDLAALLVTSPVANTPIPAAIIEFHTLGAGKKASSAIRIVEIPLQITMPAVVSVSGSSITINDADTKKAYEYSLVKKGTTFSMSTAKWTQITSARVTVDKKAEVGDKILVRIKSTVDKTTKQVILASTYIEVPITSVTK